MLVYIDFNVSPPAAGGTVSDFIFTQVELNDGSIAVTTSNGSFTVCGSGTGVSMSMPEVTGYPGDSISVPVNISNVAGAEITSVLLKVSYDPGILTATGHDSTGTLTESWLMDSGMDTSGQIVIAGASSSALSQDGILVYMDFDVSPSAIGGTVSDLIFTEVELNDGDIYASTANGSVPISVTLGVDVSIFEITGYAGEKIAIPVNISGVEGLDITDALLKVSYDPDILTATGISTDGTIAQSWMTDSGVVPGQIIIGMASSSPLDQDGILIFINFDIDADAAGKISDLILTEVEVNDGNIVAHTEDGVLTICGQKVLNLYRGWNFISTCLDLANNDILTVLGPITGLWVGVWSYSANLGWQRHVFKGPAPLNDLNTIEPGSGYAIYMISDTTLSISGCPLANTTIHLYRGWNFVGFNSPTPQASADALSSMPDGTIIHTYDGITKTWSMYIVGDSDSRNTIDEFQPGKAYYIYIEQDFDWQVVP